MMRRLQIGLFLVVLCFAVPAWSSVVIPGASADGTDTFTYVDGFIDDGTCSVPECGAFEARLLSAVYRNDSTGNLLFLWQIINDSDVTFSIGFAQTWRFFPPELAALTLTTGYTNDEDLYNDLDNSGLTPFPVPGTEPTNITWLAPLVRTTFGTALAPGDNSSFWFAYTDAQAYTRTVNPFPTCEASPEEGDNACTAQAFAYEELLTKARNFDTFEPAAVPEPASLFLMGSGLVGLAGMMRRKLAK